MLKEFIGADYENLQQKDKILNTYDKFQKNKLEYINEMYNEKSTQTSNWILYERNIHFDEVNKNKDLLHYTPEEIENLVASKVAYSEQTKNNLLVFIYKYMEWNISRGEIVINPCNSINRAELKKGSLKVIRKKLLALNEFWGLIEQMDKITDMSNYMPLILARYGITGKELNSMIYLKWEDIVPYNGEYKVIIYDENRNILAELPVDDKFINIIKRFKKHDYIVYSKKDSSDRKGLNLIDYGYVLKKTSSSDGETETYNTIFGKVTRCCSALGVKRISFNDMVKSRKMDVLLAIRLERKINGYDITNINNMYSLDNNSVNGDTKLKKLYEDLTKDKVLRKNDKNKDMADLEAKSKVQEFCEKLNIDISYIIELNSTIKRLGLI